MHLRFPSHGGWRYADFIFQSSCGIQGDTLDLEADQLHSKRQVQALLSVTKLTDTVYDTLKAIFILIWFFFFSFRFRFEDTLLIPREIRLSNNPDMHMQLYKGKGEQYNTEIRKVRRIHTIYTTVCTGITSLNSLYSLATKAVMVILVWLGYTINFI